MIFKSKILINCFKDTWKRKSFYGSKILSCSGLKTAMEHAH